MKKTDILDVVSRKLTPFMFLFGFYLFVYGHLSPGGGFQGGVVIASGIILLVVSRGVKATSELFPFSWLLITEAVCFFLLVATGLAGIFAGTGFLSNPVAQTEATLLPRVSKIMLMNTLIGAKVGAGVGCICLRLFREE